MLKPSSNWFGKSGHLGVFFLGLICLLISNEGFSQSGWTKGKKEGFYQLSYQSMVSRDYYTLGGEKLETNQFSQQSLVFYGEYGVTDQFTILANWPLQTWNGFETTETVSGLGDIKVELKHALLKKYLPLSISITPEIPIGRANHIAKSKVNDFEEINLPSGDGEFNVWGTLASSFALPNTPLYGSLFGTYNYRTQYNDIQFSDQVGFGAELGYQIAGIVWVNAKINALKSINEVTTVSDFVRGDGTEFTSYSFGTSVPVFRDIHLTLNYRNFNDWIFSRKNLYSAGVLGLGLYYQVKPKQQ